MGNIHYEIGKSTLNDILNHLKKCDELFIPFLSKRVDLENYSQKIFQSAINFEAWSNNILIGLISVYKNSTEDEFFITNVSLEKQLSGKGIAATLMNMLIDFGLDQKVKFIKLEVNKNNINALKLYKKFNFEIEEEINENLFLKKHL